MSRSIKPDYNKYMLSLLTNVCFDFDHMGSMKQA